MKKFTILLSLLFASTAIFAQITDHKQVQALNPTSFLDRGLNSSFSTKPAAQPQHKKPVPSTRSTIVVDTLGTAANAYTTLSSECNNVTANQDLNTVIFIHRNDNTKFENVISHYRYDISTDGGSNFTINNGPLNPNCKDSVGWYNSRFPMISIYNKEGNTNPDSAHLVYLGSWHDNSGAASNSIWNGIITGAARLDGDVSTRTEADITANDGNTLIAASLCHGLPGEFWAVDNEQSGSNNDSMIIVYKGVWDTTSNDISWTVNKLLNPHFSQAGGVARLTPVIGFDPTGMIGWIGSCADFGGDMAGSLTPFLFNTTDGGNTWTGPYVANLLNLPEVMLGISNQSNSGVPIAGFEVDLGVDKNGRPHLVSVVGSCGIDPQNLVLNHSIESRLNMNLFDFSYSTTTSEWSTARVDTILTFRGRIGIGTEGVYEQDNRPQVSVNKDGSKISFIWSDSPLNAEFYENSIPDLFGTSLDVNTNLWAPTTIFTDGDPDWGGNATFACVSPNSLQIANNINIPVVITQLDAQSKDPTLPASFYYFEGINFGLDAYTTSKFVGINKVEKASSNITLFPNPADNNVFIAVPAELKNSTINVYNVLGQLVFSDKMNNNAAYVLNTKAFVKGTYTLSIVSGTNVATKQLVVTH